MNAVNSGKYVDATNFNIDGVSYIGRPISNTAMFVTRKIEEKVFNLKFVSGCLVFAEDGIEIPSTILKNNAIDFSKNPQLRYIQFCEELESILMMNEKDIAFDIVNGSYISETAVIGPGAYIEPGCRIGHNVVIGENASIKTGTVISNAVIGDNFLSNEYAVLGANGFTMTDNECGDKIRIPSLGRVVIGNNVEVGTHDNISRGSAGDTVLKDNVKLDAFVHIGHDAVIEKNTEVTAGAIIGGFDEIGESSFIGLSAILRNRIKIGEKAIVGMGAVVTKSVPSGITVIGNPARPMVSQKTDMGGWLRKDEFSLVLFAPSRRCAA